MGEIALLDEKTASQIAAGEVVERPANVVKELLENAIDAGATRVTIDIEGGGLDRICVSDDGRGMASDDAVLCFSPHSTSKLVAIDDLSSIATFGFRGEALASIASVSKVTLTTRQVSADSASQTGVEGGRVVHVGEVGAPPGTQIDVRDLFFNVPARRKFLKSARTEQNHIERVVRTSALAHPFLSFRLRMDGRVVFDMHAAQSGTLLSHPSRRERAIACLGENVRPHLFELETHSELVRISGYGVSPHCTRRDFAGVHVAINGRPVRDRQLSQGICTAYRPVLEIGRKPIAALSIEVDPASVDVNVHPQKEEVRFSDARRVNSHVIKLLHDALSLTPWLSSKNVRTYALKKSAPSALQKAHTDRVRDAFSRFQKKRTSFSSTSSPNTPAPRVSKTTSAFSGATHKPLGMVRDRFLVVAAPEGMEIIDTQKALDVIFRERIRRAQLGQSSSRVPLLFPWVCAPFPKADLAFVERLGFEIESSDEEFIVRTLPRYLRAKEIERVLPAVFSHSGDEIALLRVMLGAAQTLNEDSRDLLRFYAELQSCDGAEKAKRHIGEAALEGMFS